VFIRGHTSAGLSRPTGLLYLDFAVYLCVFHYPEGNVSATFSLHLPWFGANLAGGLQHTL